MYAKVSNGVLFQHPYSIADLKADHPNTSFPDAVNVALLGDFGIVAVTPTAAPAYNAITQSIAEVSPVLIDSAWTQQWAVSDVDAPTVAANQAQAEAQRIASLWQAAHDMEYEAISGSAIGLITIGILQSKVKCLAVQAWIQSIWTLYYTRKAGTSTDTDYSSVGPCPHTVPDLMVELGL